MSVKRFRPRATVEAIQYDGTNAIEIAEWAGPSISQIPHDTDLWLAVAPNGMDRVIIGDWIIRGTTGGFFSRSAEQFAKDYEPQPNPVEVAQKRLRDAHSAVVDAAQELAEAMAAAVGVPQR